MMSGETMREAVARAMAKASCGNGDCWRLYTDEADAAIRTVLERLREPSESAVQAGDEVMYGRYGCSFEVRPIWQAMLDAAITPPLPEPADSGRG